MFTVSEMKQNGLINNLMIVHPIYDKIIPLEHVCKCLFGVKNLPITTCCIKLELDRIITKYNNIWYIIISRFEYFIDRIGDLNKYMSKYLVINYYNFLRYELYGIQKDIQHFNGQFVEYLKKHTPIHHNTIIQMIGKDVFNGMLVKNEQNKITISYNICSITYGYDSIDSVTSQNGKTDVCVCLLNIDKTTFKKLAEDIFQILLHANSDEYVCYNLTSITGNETFAKMLVMAHNAPNDHIIPIEVAMSVLLFKNKQQQEYYTSKFMTTYKCGTIWNEINGAIMVNFEGLNRYYLNLEESFIDNKEEVSSLYYNITNELIGSYKILYEYHKK